MDQGAAKTCSTMEVVTTASCTDCSFPTSECQHKAQLKRQQPHHPPSHLSAAMCLSIVSEALDPFFDNIKTPAHQKRQQTTAETPLITAKYDDEACAQQNMVNADADPLSVSEDPKGIATAGEAGRSVEALDMLILPANSWSDMVQEMESENKSSRVPRKG